MTRYDPSVTRFSPSRTTRVAGLLMALSTLYWVAVWGWVRAEVAALEAGGTHPVVLAMREMSLVYPFTWGWVVGGGALHGGLAALTWWRDDRRALAGVGLSLVIHLAFAVGSGVLAIPD